MGAKLSTKPNFIGPLVNSLKGEKKCIQLKQQFSCQRLSVMRISDVAHGLKVGELNIKSDEIKKGKETLAQFTPNETGHYVGQCAHFCESGHGSMKLQIEVVPRGSANCSHP